MISVIASGDKFEVYDNNILVLSGKRDVFFIAHELNEINPNSNVITIFSESSFFRFEIKRTSYPNVREAMLDIAEKIFLNFDKTNWGSTVIESQSSYFIVNKNNLN
jgi:hypothetical protein